ncbi:hypothetical protein Lal_00017541 [Lupinus albus]|nr:hypothetical protein Lal_00017541 [Lupinus albus]
MLETIVDLQLKLTFDTASPRRTLFADWPDTCSCLGNIKNSKSATSEYFGCDLSSGSTKCSISASIDRYLAPKRKNIGFNRTTRRTIIIESSNTSIYLKRRYIKQSPFQCVHHRLTERFLINRPLSVRYERVGGGFELTDGVALSFQGGLLIGKSFAEG